MGAPTGLPVAGFHSRTAPPPSALASSVPSGLNATAETPLKGMVAAIGAPTGWPVAGFHSRTVPSPPPLASSLPLGLNATAYTPCMALACMGAPTGWPVAGFHSRTVPPPPRAGQQPAVGAERHPGHRDRVGGQHAFLLLLGQQRGDGGRGLAGGEDGPGGEGELSGGHWIGAVDVEAFGGELARQGDRMLVAGAGGIVDGEPGGGQGGQGESDKAGDRCPPPAHGMAVSMAAGVEEVTLGLAERRVAGGIGADPGGGAGRCGQQGAGVKVGAVAGVAGPLGGGGVQPGADDAVGVAVGEPGVPQQRPGGQQRFMAELHGAGSEGEQPFGGEGLQCRLHLLGPGGGFALGQFRPGGAIGGIHHLGPAAVSRRNTCRAAACWAGVRPS